MTKMVEWELRQLLLPRGTTRAEARRMLTEQAEYGSWELRRVRIYPDGSRRIWLRRKIIRAVLTSDLGSVYEY